MAGPYLTPVELTDAPTGVNWSSIPSSGASSQQQLAEQLNLIQRATRFIDSQCGQKLYATTDQELFELPGLRAQARLDGSITIITRNSPVVTVQLIEYSADGTNFATLPWKAMNKAKAVVALLPGLLAAPVPFYSQIARGWLRVTYIDGFPSGVTMANANQGDTSLTLDDATGIQPNQALTLYDGELTQETITIASSYTPATGIVGLPAPGTIPLASGLAFAHTAGAHVSALPSEVREAAIIAAVHYARYRGRDTLAIAAAGGERQVRSQGITQELDEARDVLAKGGYRRLL